MLFVNFVLIMNKKEGLKILIANKFKIVLIGSGNVATILGLKLNEYFEIIQIYSRNLNNAKTLADKFNCSYTNSIVNINQKADLYLFSISDDVINEILEKFCFKMNFAVHTSGSLKKEVFKKYSANFGVLYPLQTFEKDKSIRFKDVPFLIEANNKESIYKLNKIAEKLSKKIYISDYIKRLKIHISAIFMCNFTNHMASLGNEFAKKNDIDTDIFKGLIIETFDKLINTNPVNAQTGPAKRKDLNIIKKHLSVLKDDKELQKMYKFVSESIMNLYKNDQF